MAEKTRDRAETKAAGNGRASEALSELAVEQMASPENLKAYEEAAPGSAAKVVEVYMAQLAHRRELEQRQARTNSRRDLTAAVIAAVLALAVFGASAWLVSIGFSWSGTILGVLAILGAFVMLIFRRRS